MENIEDYMKDPSVAFEPMPLRKLRAIRLMIHDRTKDMTSAEKTAYCNKKLAEAQKEYGFKVAATAGRG
jgi:hypothetical protein